MARSYTVNFNDSLYLTDTGLINGLPCKLEIPNLEDLLINIVGRAEISADGTPNIQTFEWVKGKSFEIKIFQLKETVWEQVTTLLKNSLINSTTININGFGDIGDFDVSVIPNPSKPFRAERFVNSRIYGITLSFITN